MIVGPLAHFDEVVTDPRVRRAEVERFLADPARLGEAYLGRYLAWTTSGTTGHPGMFIHDEHAWTIYKILGATRGFSRWLGPSGLASFLLRGRASAIVALDCGPYAEVVGVARERRAHPRLLRRFWPIVSVLRPLEEQVRELNARRPLVMSGYPSALLLLAEEQAAGRLRIAPLLIVLSGESIPRPAKERIAEAFGCPVREMFAASEGPSLAFECEAGRLHLNSDWFLLEGVDRDYHPVPPGEQSETVLVTNLVNRVMPIIRYDLGDCITLEPGPCGCGRALPAFRVEGRSTDVLTLPPAAGSSPVRLTPLALVTVIEETPGVYRVQVVRAGPAALAVRLEVTPTADVGDVWGKIARRVREYLDVQGVGPVELRLAPEAPQRNRMSGKLR